MAEINLNNHNWSQTKQKIQFTTSSTKIVEDIIATRTTVNLRIITVRSDWLSRAKEQRTDIAGSIPSPITFFTCKCFELTYMLIYLNIMLNYLYNFYRSSTLDSPNQNLSGEILPEFDVGVKISLKSLKKSAFIECGLFKYETLEYTIWIS